MEILYSARSSMEFIALESELDALRIVRNDRAVADAAMRAVAELAAHNDGYHRVPLTDALIAPRPPSTEALRCCIAMRTSTGCQRRLRCRA